MTIEQSVKLERAMDRLDTLETEVRDLRSTVGALRALAVNSPNADLSEPVPRKLPKKTEQRFQRMGLDTRFVGVTNEDQVLELRAAREDQLLTAASRAGALNTKH